MTIGKTCGEEQQLSILDQRGDELLGWTRHIPLLSAGARVVTRHAFTSRQHQLCSSTELANDRRHVAACIVRSRSAPLRLAGLTCKCHDVPVAVVIAVDDQLVLEQYRGATETVDT